ncbi:MAG: hypothetical protein IJB52_10570 [Clostridia bacterium]|nr:hypothetical protein [Clostridia bacterium]
MESDRQAMIREILEMLEKMTPEQREIYMEVVRDMFGDLPGKNIDKKAG